MRSLITWDRGSEMAPWPQSQPQLNAPVYFCDPHSPWQRGANENTNRLLRFWFEKRTDLSGVFQRRSQTYPRHPQPPPETHTQTAHKGWPP
jgi:transposase, IS30 family